MNRVSWSRSLIGLFLLAAISGCDPSQTAPLDAAHRATIESEVDAFLSSYREAFNRRDLEAVANLYVSDGRFALFEDGALRYPTPQSIVEALSSLPPGMSMTTEGATTDILPLSGDLAMASTRHHTQVTLPGGGAFEIEGVMTALLERSADGWRIVRAHTSSVRDRGGP